MTQAALLEHVTKTIVDRFRPKRIMIFGSHGRGEAGPDSDLDLFIEMDTPRPPPERAAPPRGRRPRQRGVRGGTAPAGTTRSTEGRPSRSTEARHHGETSSGGDAPTSRPR